MFQPSIPVKLLVVEDEMDIAISCSFLLESEGFSVAIAENGLIALEYLQNNELPRLILLDMKMPIMDGWAFAAEFKARYDRKTPILIMTAAADAEKRAQEIDAEGWIGKPFSIEDLLAAVARICGHRGLLKSG